ncbi:alpha/beta fold hydrolase [uncultured Propionibacterium sp.]|uniref:alpha/beta hydrolase family protein n=1 Tax=uncultured Propionibacterium sp. TaxID=218066 RepID=UPI00292E9085|nr:alpha/beta fold hydrolase [uncultured Propionibacterium sp.]
MTAKDLGARGNTGIVFRNGVMDFNADVLLGFAQQGGMAPGALMQAFRRIRNGSPASWASVFTDLARRFEASAAAAEDHSATQVAHRAALAMLDPRTGEAREANAGMGRAFRRYLRAAGILLEHRPIPFRSRLLPAYATRSIGSADRLVLVIGGGDTYVEDLWFFGARALVEAGWPVVMVDLPGQGFTPDQGLYFGPSTLEAIAAVLDDLHARGFAGEVVMLGWSGGGILTTKYASAARPEDRIAALVASAPAHDARAMFERALPGVLRRNPDSRLLRVLLSVVRCDPVLDASLSKYDWQFGPAGLMGTLDAVGESVRTDPSLLDLPVLALVGADESEESARQAETVVDAVRPAHPSSRVVTFPAWTGAAAHCQIGNIPLAMREVLGWLDETLRGGIACDWTPWLAARRGARAFWG